MYYVSVTMKISSLPHFILNQLLIFQSTAFTIVERQILGIHGLLPPSVDTQAVQMHRIMTELREKTPLQQYIMLTALLTRNERLFYSLLVEHTEELMPIVYTPTVGLACQEYGLIFRDPRFGEDHDILFTL